MKKLLSIFSLMLIAVAVTAQQKVSVKWQLSDIQNLGATVITGDDDNVLTPNFLKGSAIADVKEMASGNADANYDPPIYNPVFAQFYVTTKKTAKTSGHNIAVSITPASGHTLKPTKISFDAAKCGTNGGNFDLYYKNNGGTETAIATGVSPLRNKVGENNPDGYSHHEYVLSDLLTKDGSLVLFLYIYNVNGTDDENPKAIAFRNIVIEGVMDEPVYDASHYVSAVTCKTAAGDAIDLYDIIKNLGNGGQGSYPDLLFGDPKDFQVTATDGYTCQVEYANNTATYKVFDNDNDEVFGFSVLFRVTHREPKPAATPLKRGLMAVNLGTSGSSGNLVSWRSRKTDGKNYKFKLYRGSTASAQKTKVNSGNFIMGKTNFLDSNGTATSYYKLEVYDGNNQLIETEEGVKTWGNQTKNIPLADAPIDTQNGATYTPHDAAICDMDGDGEYNIILKWMPSNAKDAASNGVTSNIYFDCYKMDGTFMWRIDLGQNFFASQHTVQFICWDFDGDGYGEFMVKTAPGTKDGEGNWVLLGDDDPTENLKSSRGKQDHGSEYITVFDGMTGAQISTIPYHSPYAYTNWGDSKQNRSERYLAAIAWLDGEDGNPSPIFARGYYNAACVGAYDFDGVNLKERWVSRNLTSGKGLYGEGAHWLLVGDCDDDGKQEMVYGSAILDHDGTLHSRSGFGHGDALHMSDFITTNPGKEIFMVHEDSPNWGYSMRDARTGKVLKHWKATGDDGRGLAAHFDHEQMSAQFMHSASPAIYNCDTYEELASSWAIGSSGAGINNRIFWDGDLADEFFDKSILAHWNSTGKYFDRYQFNGGNYTWGKLNDDSKYHPCLLGDIMGDWREELLTWDKGSDGKYYLILSATNYSSDYLVPHLMDELDYRAQVIAQNVCYNQPPHMPYDMITEYTVERTLENIGMTDDFAEKHEDMGDYWDCFYTTYPVEVPSGVTLWSVSGIDNSADTLKVTKLKAGNTIPANRGVIFNSKDTTAKFRPSIKSASSVTNTYLKGFYCDSLLTSTDKTVFYRFMDGENGLGFYKVDAEVIEGRTGFLQVASSSANPASDFYRLGDMINPTYVDPVATDVIEVETVVKKAAEPVGYYHLDGRMVEKPTVSGNYIVKMSDGSVKKISVK